MGYSIENQLGLVTYFAEKADALEAHAKSARIFENPVDKGDVRENIV